MLNHDMPGPMLDTGGSNNHYIEEDDLLLKNLMSPIDRVSQSDLSKQG